MKIDQLVNDLAADISNGRRMPPFRRLFWLVPVFACYFAAAQFIVGVRPDIVVQLQNPLFLGEVVLLLVLAIYSVTAAGALAYPDQRQLRLTVRIPGYLSAALLGFLLYSLRKSGSAPATSGIHSIECTLSIALIGTIPALLLAVLLRLGACIKPGLAGAYVVFAAAAFGALNLRLGESADSMPHLLCWHYLPVLLFAAIGTWLGSRLLRW